MAKAHVVGREEIQVRFRCGHHKIPSNTYELADGRGICLQCKRDKAKRYSRCQHPNSKLSPWTFPEKPLLEVVWK